jgi:crotonobetainyl-CoA:carnitine CoA-transferase CaiB-like acyl-CoA transferase
MVVEGAAPVTAEPLSGVRVVEMCGGAGGLVAGALLAGLGAEVVKVGRPAQAVAEDEPFLVWADRAKHATTLSLDDPGDWAELRRLTDQADAFITDAPPGNLERRGLDSVTLSGRHPDLVQAWLPAFGQVGRWSQLEYDPLLLSGVSGYAEHYPTEKDQPIAPVVPTFAYLHGAMGAAAVVAGLVGRQRDRQGRAVTVSGLHAVGSALATLMAGGIDVDRVISPGRSPRAGPFFRLYQGSDGRWFYVAALSPAIFFRALEAIGRMDIMVRDDVAGEFSNLMLPAVGRATSLELEGTFATKPAEEWLELLRAAEVPAAAVWDREEWAASDMADQIIGWIDFDDKSVGRVRAQAFPLTITPGSPAGGSTRSDGAAAAAGPPASLALPLQGLKVVDTSTFLAAPFSSALLADWGADVVKVEPIEGDPYRTHSISHAVANQHKRGVALDLKDPAAQEAFLELVRTCDVLLDNARGDRLARMGLDEPTLARRNPALIRCSVSAFGSKKPWADLPGFDPVLQSMTGLAAAQGGDAPPAPSSAPVVDAGTGVLAALGILTAVYARGVDGKPRHVRTSLAAGAVFIQSAELTTYRSRPAPARGGADFIGPDPFVRFYQTRDGWLAVAARTDARRAALCGVCGVDENEPGQLAGVFERADSVDWVDRLAFVGVPAAIVRKRDGAIRDGYLKANGITDRIHIPDVGWFDAIGHYARWCAASSPTGRGYRVGEDTLSELKRAGLPSETIDDLIKRRKAAVSVKSTGEQALRPSPPSGRS